MCSLYLLEGADLVMRGNVGFPANALGEIRLGVGEGITGLAVEYMRPMSLDTAPDHASYRRFPGLDEDRYPIFLAVPVAGPTGPLGALVLQRKEPPAFDRADIELASALTSPIAAAAERARLVDALRGQKRATGGGTRRVTLPGRTVVAGRAVGAICAFLRPAARAKAEAGSTTPPKENPAKLLDGAITQARKTLDALEKRAKTLELDVGFFNGVRMILDDGRLRERVLELAKDNGGGLTTALGTVGAEAVRTASRVGDAFGLDRAREIADVCEALAMLASTDRRAEVPRNAVLVGDQVTMFDLLVSTRAQPAAVVLSERANGAVSRTLLALIGVPSVVDVGGLFRWVSDGDIALVDGDHGLVRLNPSRAEVSMVREDKRRAAEPAA